jgi:hypothetical protein
MVHEGYLANILPEEYSTKPVRRDRVDRELAYISRGH